ncbi:tyrosine-type recombinase/integrase [Alishewanella sp. 16-MA]|uniref:Tyrosine-type recombinase/integrase n=1 Tax=Alishewanella maricola TaxID=2795740 RepID=A0ABS8C1L2_9ALTE|nr:tyrosine-type recombinase/integrase [Alishewanella maricola]MCB5226222.1 tyrosine-type recombinase/integrase [Alishewanella maricola]
MSLQPIAITETAIKNAVNDASVTELRDIRSRLHIRFHSCRTKATWFLQRYEGGKRLRHKIGYWPELKIKDALSLVTPLLNRIGHGEQMQSSEFRTVGDMLNWYLKRLEAEKVKSKSRRNGATSAIKKHLLPRLGKLFIADVKKITIDEMLMLPLQKASLKTSTIKQYFAILKRVFASAAELELITINPMLSMQFKDHVQKRIEPKMGSLMVSDIGRVASHFITLPEPAKTMLMLMLMFATRIGETRQLRWNYIDFDAGQITIPGRITKTGVTHNLPLTEFSVAILKAYQAHSTGPYLFGEHTAMSSSDADRIVRSISKRKWSAHDLRKVARSSWAVLGVDFWVSERLLNHVQKGLDLVYVSVVNTDMLTLKRDALERYHEWLKEQIKTANQAPIEISKIT